MKIGIRAHDVGKDKADLLFKKIKSLGFDYIQLVFKKALVDDKYNPLDFNENNILDIAKALKDHSLFVAMLGAYFNPVHSNKDLVKKNIIYFKKHLELGHLLNCKYVGTETGSYNDDKWTYNPKNRTKEGYNETLSIFKELVKSAEKNNATILMEPAYGHVIYDVDTLIKAVNEINSPNLKVTIDIYNLLCFENYRNYKDIFISALSYFKEDVKIIHLKDFYPLEDTLKQCGIGKGIIDFDFIISIVKKYAPEAILIFEGVQGEDIPYGLEIISALVRKYRD